MHFSPLNGCPGGNLLGNNAAEAKYYHSSESSTEVRNKRGLPQLLFKFA
jgi:hypothetical protein